MSDDTQDIRMIAENLIKDAFSELDSGIAFPDYKTMEAHVDGFCKSKDWLTPGRYDLYQEIMRQLQERKDNDKQIDIAIVASDIFNNMDSINDVQDDAIEESVVNYLLYDHLYTLARLSDVRDRVVKYIEQAISVTYYPNEGES